MINYTSSYYEVVGSIPRSNLDSVHQLGQHCLSDQIQQRLLQLQLVSDKVLLGVDQEDTMVSCTSLSTHQRLMYNRLVVIFLLHGKISYIQPKILRITLYFCLIHPANQEKLARLKFVIQLTDGLTDRGQLQASFASKIQVYTSQVRFSTYLCVME